ncbi:phytoene/squalene synthase family protein [soil metagenome]
MSDHASQVIRAGSSSFAAAARLFDESTRQSTVMLYAWCRHCDDVIDGQQLGHGQLEGDRENGLEQLMALEAATLRACLGQPDDHPVFIGLAEVVRRHGLPQHLPMEHLRGFRMDVMHAQYRTLDDTLLYCYRVAGVVGLMMAHVMGTRDAATLDRACDLGIAFQLTNIARDIVEDAKIGRVYVPGEWLDDAGIAVDELTLPDHRRALAGIAAKLVASADPYYASALDGIGALPLRSAWSVATARDVYRAIGRKVRDLGLHAWDRRVSTSPLAKLWYVARGAAVALVTRGWRLGARPQHLWQRP